MLRHAGSLSSARFLVLFTLAAGLIWSTPALPPPGGGPGAKPYVPHVPGEILIKFKSSARALDRANAKALVRGQGLKRFRSGAEHWKLGKGVTTEKAIAKLLRHPQVQYAEPNYLVQADLAPDDPRYTELWGLNNVGQTGGTPGADIDVERAWSTSTGSRGVMVAVIDTGIDYNHPDLAANIWTNPGEIPSNGIDDDGNGFIDDIHGWDFYNNDNDPMDDHSHGTHVAGTIGAVGNNATGVAGVNWEVTLIALKFLSASGSGSTADAISAVDYAAGIGAHITNNSWGGGGFSQALLDSINAAGDAGSLFVAAAGNNGEDTDLFPHYPSSYDSPYVLSVASTDHRDLRSSFSNFGLVSVDLGAPGSSILSTVPGGGYGSKSGTSMATPHVAGAAALVLSTLPGLPPTSVKQAIMRGAELIPSMSGITVTGGRLNALAAVSEPETVPPGAINDLVASQPASNSVMLTWTATGDDADQGSAFAYDLRQSPAPIDANSFDTATAVPIPLVPAPAGSPESFEVGGLAPDTTYHFALRAIDDWTNEGPVSNDASETTLPPPTFASSPSSFSFSLLTGETAADTLVLSNVGLGTLDWTAAATSGGGTAPAPLEPLPLAKGETDTRAGTASSAGRGGPDGHGYRFVDGDQSSGPAFGWVDISASGTPVAGLDGDDQVSGPIDLGFQMPFYGDAYDAVRVSTDGWLSFTSSLPAPVHQPLPCAGAPENIIAPFWTDLDFKGGGRVTYARSWDSITFQFTDVPRRDASGRFTFQVVLQGDGGILFKYLSMEGDAETATVGIQKGSGDDGLLIAFNASYVHDGMAIQIQAAGSWLSASPTQGRIVEGQSENVTVAVDAFRLQGGIYSGSVEIATNDPNRPLVSHDVTLEVTDAPFITVAPESLDFGEVLVGFSGALPLTILNAGTADLTISSITSADPEVVASPPSLALAPGEIFDIAVIFSPSSAGALSTMLSINSDAPLDPVITIPVTGAAAPAPSIQASPSSLFQTLLTGETATQTLTVSNTGSTDLLVSLSTEVTQSGSGAGAGWTERPKGDESDNGAGATAEPGQAQGQDGSRYGFTDSTMPGGPVFAWTDIWAAGDVVPVKGDDETSEAIPLGFEFPFYGGVFDSVHVSSNGWLSFTGEGTAFSNPDVLPNTGTSVPRNLIAPFFDDLDFQGAIHAKYSAGPDRFIVQYSGVDRAGGGSDLTFQVILHSDGRIRFQYQSVSGVLDSATIGIQNADGTEGLLISYNEPYVRNGLAVELDSSVQLVNGGLESGSFSGWVTTSNGRGELTPWTVSGPGAGWFANSNPWEGSFDALNGFDGDAGLHYTLYQDIALPLILGDSELSFYDRIQYDSLGIFSSQPRVYEATIRDTSGAVLAVIAREEILVSGRPYTDLGWQRRSIDLRPWSGQTIRIQIDEDIPESFTGPGLIEFDDFRIGTQIIPDWLSVTPAGETIPPGLSRDFSVLFEAGASGTAQYLGAVRIDSNDPAAPLVRIPASLSVIGAPNIVVQGQEVTLESVIDYGGSGSITNHVLNTGFNLVANTAAIEVKVDGDYGDGSETAAISAEGIFLGSVGAVGADCLSDEDAFPLSASEVAGLTADGVLNVTVENSSNVDSFCAVNRHTVRFRYRSLATSLEFGSLFVGASTSLEILVSNTGQDPLNVSSVLADDPAFSASPPAFTVAPGASQPVTITFAPALVAAISATLSIASDDPDTPVETVPLTGTGLDPPVASVSPASLTSSLISGQEETQLLTLSNGGGSPLEFKILPRGRISGGTACTFESLLVTDFGTGSLLEVDLATGALTTIVAGLGGPNKGLAVDSTGGTAFLTESYSGELTSVDLASGIATAVQTGLLFPNGMALNADDTTAYVAQTSGDLLSRIDLDTGTVTTLATGLSTPNGVTLDIWETTVYVAEYGSGEVSAVDLATGAVTVPASGLTGPVAQALDSAESRLFIAEEGASRLSVVDLSTGAITDQLNLGTAPGSLLLAPDEASVFFTGVYTGQVHQIDLATGAVTVVASGMTTPVGIAANVPSLCRGDFLTPVPSAGAVDPFGSLPVDVLISAVGLNGGTYTAELDILTNDPVTPELLVPVSLDVTGFPVIKLQGERLTVESVIGYSVSGATTTHELELPESFEGDAFVEIVADGDYGFSGETATLTAEGIPLGTVGAVGSDCAAATGTFTLREADLLAIGADGFVTVTVENSALVDAFCVVNQHTVRLILRSSFGLLDFGEVFLGVTAQRSVSIVNDGTDVLDVTSITSSHPDYTVTPSSFSLEPGREQPITVTYAPPAVGATSGILEIASNDPNRPLVSLQLAGSGLEPPIVGASPSALSSTLFSGQMETQVLTLTNAGGSDLDFNINILPLGSQARTYPFAGLAPTGRGLSDNDGTAAVGPSGRMATPDPDLEDDLSGPAEDPSGGAAPFIGAPGDFESLANSPSALTCVAGDPLSLDLYAQQNNGTAFYRYVATNNAWETLATAPINSGNNGGAAILNGKVYTSYTGNSSTLGVYDISTNSWSTLTLPFPGGTANIASDGSQYLYFALGTSLRRLDPVTMQAVSLASPPTSFQRWGGLEHFNGMLYGHSGNGSTGFASYDIAADRWRPLPPVPSGAVLGSALDPSGTTYLAYGSYGGNNLYQFDITLETWSVMTVPFFSLNDGGMAYLPGPVPGIYFVQGQDGTGFARLVTGVSFLTLSHPSGTVPAGGSLDVDVTFDTAKLLGGTYESRLSIQSNDPVTPDLSVPVSLTVIGAPDIQIRGTVFAVQSTKSYTTSGAITTHSLVLSEPPAAGGVMRLTANGDYGGTLETATMTVEGLVLGSVGGVGPDCTSARGAFTLTPEKVASIAADGVVDVLVQNASAVDVFCTVNEHTVEFEYPGRADLLDYGDVFIGGDRSLSFTILNNGTDVLQATLASPFTEFAVSPTDVTLPPRHSVLVTVTFAPTAPGTLSGALLISSNDPVDPELTVAVTGTGLIPPIVGHSPAQLAAVALEGESDTQILTVTNAGGSDLTFNLGNGGHSFLSFAPFKGIVPAGGSLDVNATFKAGTLLPGLYTGTFPISSNDPVTPLLHVRFEFRIRGIPGIEIPGLPGKVHLESSMDFVGSRAITLQTLAPTPPPSKAGLLEVTVIGDFAGTAHSAAVFVDGTFLGLVGQGKGTGCTVVTKIFTISEGLLTSLTSDGKIVVRMNNSLIVDDYCPVNRHAVKLDYNQAGGQSFDFGNVFVGGSGTKPLVIHSVGTDVLQVSLSTTLPEFTLSPSTLAIDPGDFATAWITFSPGSATTFTDTLQINSNDPLKPILTAGMVGEGVPAPVAGVSPTSFEMAVPPGGAAARTMEISNTGLSALEWEIQTSALALAGGVDPPVSGRGRAGGPDAFGYVFRDSEAPDGPAYQWEEISVTGTPAPLGGDDETTGPIALGFSFPFYGSRFDSVRITTNGWLSFTNPGTGYRPHDTLPYAGPASVENLVAPFWEDLDLEGVQKVFYLSEGDRFIVQYTGVDRIQGDSDLTFQAILFSSGRIVFQYAGLSGIRDGATVGIQNGDASMGLLVSAGEDYVRDGLAVEFVPPPPGWLTYSPASGTVPPGGAVDVILTADAATLPDGDHGAVISVLSNDPINGRIDATLLLHAGYTDLDLVDVEPNSLNLSSQGKTVRGMMQLPAHLDPGQILIPTVSINGQLYARPSPVTIADENGDGTDELILKFDRAGLEAILGEGQSIPVTVTGEVRNTTWFTGTDHIKAMRPQVTHPNGGEYFVSGESVVITWEPPDIQSPVTYHVILSRDGGGTWESVASGLTGLSTTWTAAGASSDQMLVRVLASDSQGVIGYDTGDGRFTVADLLHPPNPVAGVDAAMDGGDLILSWGPPPTDLLHGPASVYRILASATAAGPFQEIGTSTAVSFRITQSALPPGAAFYQVGAANASGEEVPSP